MGKAEIDAWAKGIALPLHRTKSRKKTPQIFMFISWKQELIAFSISRTVTTRKQLPHERIVFK